MSATLTEVAVQPIAPGRFRDQILNEDAWPALADTFERARTLLEGRVVWNISSRARSGGLGDLVRSMTALARGVGVDARWEVLDASADFYRLAKRLHNNLHGFNDHGRGYGAAERLLYEATVGGRIDLTAVNPGDIVVLHDPQTAGIVPAAKARRAIVIWRCHVGLDAPNDVARGAWRFLTPYLEQADAYVFSRLQFLWERLDQAKASVIRPSLNVLSPKNQDLSHETVAAILARTGIQPDEHGDPLYARLDGSPGRVDRRSDLLGTAPLPPAVPLLLQVSHWNHLKDPAGLVRFYARELAHHCDADLLIAGPPAAAVKDEPEAKRVLTETIGAWQQLPDDMRARVHLAAVPTDDPQEAAAIINALQRRGTVVVQNSRGEGFGMTILEAMWKRRPVVCTRVGGIQEQVVNGVTGYLIDVDDARTAGQAILALLADPEQRERMGEAARQRVRADFLLPREAVDWTDLIAHLIAPRGEG
jgi:trehalose synthase